MMNEPTLTELIKNKEIKTALVGGFDKNSTYEFIQQITEAFQQSLASVSREGDILKKRLSEANRKIESMDKIFKSVSETACGSMKCQRDTDQLQHRVEELELELESVKAERDAAVRAASKGEGSRKASPRTGEFERRMGGIEHRLDEMTGSIPPERIMS